MSKLTYPVLVSKSKDALESEDGMALESYESSAEEEEAVGDLRFRVVGITTGASAGPLLHNFLILAACTACVCLASLVNGSRVEETREKGTFRTPVRSFLFKALRGVGAGSLSLDDSPEEVVTAVGGSSAEGPLASSSGASGEDSRISSSLSLSLSALASWSLGDHQLSVS